MWFKDYDPRAIVARRGEHALIVRYYVTAKVVVCVVEDPAERLCFGGGVYDKERWFSMGAKERREIVSQWIKKASVPQAKGGPLYAADDAALVSECPALAEYLTLLVNAEGQPRRPSSLTIFAEDGVWKGCLSERNEPLTLWASADNLRGVLVALDALLQQQSVPWRQQRQGDPKRGARGQGRG